MSLKKIKIQITNEGHGIRVDKALSMHPDLGSRSRVQHLIDAGGITLNGKTVKASDKVVAGDIYEIQWPEKQNSQLTSYDFALDVLYEDEDLIVINKPSGLVVHPAAGHQEDTLVNALLHHTKDLSMKFGEDRPGIVHRLDKETSGNLVVAKNDQTHEHLSKQFQNRRVHRLYWALAIGSPLKVDFKFQSYIARHPVHRQRMASVRDSKNQILREQQLQFSIGKWAVTNAHVLQKNHKLASFQLKLETGRTHQIRVHLSEAGFPLLKDSVYGAERTEKTLSAGLQAEIKSFDRFFLHAAELGFIHPRSEKPMYFYSDWPAKEKEFLTRLGFHFEFSKK